MMTNFTEAEKNVGVTSSNKTNVDEFIEDVDESATPVNGIFIMYLMHSLPYAQSAFNWLFYAFLNRNLRNSSGRYNNGLRSVPITSTVLDNGPSSASGLTPLWKNLQQVGSQLKTASIDTGNALLRMSPFRTRSRIQSRSSTGLDSNYLDQMMPPSSLVSSSLLDLQRRASTTLIPREEPSLIGKALSSSDLPISQTSTDLRCKDVTVIAFIIYPAAANSFNVDSLRGQAVCKQLKDTIAKIKDNVANRMFEESVRGKVPDPEDLLLPAEKVQLKRCILASKIYGIMPVMEITLDD
uniref:Glycogen [starch] synthase n=1 Tax=Angiostrongylus cantonensis TaxID=6313 RepID=A0A0K0D6S9_ANGCA